MNKWQIDGRSLTWPNGGAKTFDSKEWPQFSIHPFGRNERHKAQQRRKRSALGV